MFMVGVLLVAVAVCLAVFRRHLFRGNTEQQSFFVRASISLFGVILASAGIYLIGFSPYFAAAGGMAFLVSFLRLGSAEFSGKAFGVGSTIVLGSVLAIITGLFASPWQGESTIEDRSDWKPEPVLPTGLDQKLAATWSTKDDHADWPVAKLMLDCCRIAYTDAVDAHQKLSQIGFEESETIHAGSMSGFVASIGDDAVIMLRGTESHVYDIVQDLRFLASTNDNGSMHGGFVDGYRGMHQQVVKLLKRYQTKRVWVTGHSLGGALAIVCAHDLLTDAEFEIAGVMTFGQPKVVRTDMRSFLEPKLDGSYVFFVNEMDPVTRVISPYIHFGHMVKFEAGEIERSSGKAKEMLFGLNVGVQVAASDPYVNSVSDKELNELIASLENKGKPIFIDGQPVMQTFYPSVSDHKMDAYEHMLDVLIQGKK